MSTIKEIGTLIYTLTLTAKEKSGKKTMNDFLPESLRQRFYGMAQGASLGPVTLHALEEGVPALKGCIIPSLKGRPTFTDKGTKVYAKLKAEGQLRCAGKGAVHTSTTPKPQKAKSLVEHLVEEVRIDPFEIGCILAILAREPAAERYLEVLKACAQAKIPLERVITTLESSHLAVTRG